jgi:hypothetical protein
MVLGDGAPLAATPVATVLTCSDTGWANFIVSQGIIDESFHADSTHSVKKVLTGGRAGFRGSGADSTTI